MNNRRTLVVALGANVLAAPLGLFAQSPAKVWRIGVLYPRGQPAPERGSMYENFIDALRDLGYVDGRNIAVQWAVAENDTQRLPALAAQLVKSKVDLIVTNGTPAVRAVQQATATIPVIALTFGDPVASGFAKTLSRPGGNITGMSTVDTELMGKRLEILVEIVPHVARIAYLANPDNPNQMRVVPEIEKHARKANKAIVIGKARGAHELDAAFAQIVRDRAGAVLIALDPVFIDHEKRVAELALQHRLPSMFGFPRGGTHGLASYGPDFRHAARSAATMAVKIFKGTKPGDIPIEQPTHFNLVVNLKTTKALGITIPPAVMVQATRVIQ